MPSLPIEWTWEPWYSGSLLRGWRNKARLIWHEKLWQHERVISLEMLEYSGIKIERIIEHLAGTTQRALLVAVDP